MSKQLNKIEKLEELTKVARKEADDFYTKGVKVAGTRLRKAMQDIKSIAQEVRVDVIDSKKD